MRTQALKGILCGTGIAFAIVSGIVVMCLIAKESREPYRKHAVSDSFPVGVYRLDYEGKVYLVTSGGGIVEHKPAQ